MQQLLAKLGLHPDQQSLGNLWVKVLALAGLVVNGGFDLAAQLAKIGLPTWNHESAQIYALCAVMLYFTAHNTDSTYRPAAGAAPARIGMWLLVLGLAGAGLGAACVHPVKVTIDVADRTAYTSARALQKAVEADYQAHQPWPSFEERRKINILLGGDPTCQPSATVVCKKGIYDLVVDVANIGLALPPGGKLSADDLKNIGLLEKAVTDLVSIVSTKASQSIQDKTAEFNTKAGTLLAVVKGATQ